MPFNSYEFIFLFLPAGATGFWLLFLFAGRSAALTWLTLASTIFYLQAGLKGLLVIVPAMAVNYFIALILLRNHSKKQLRAVAFVIGVVANILNLAYLKYRIFLLDSVNVLFEAHFEATEVVLPLGLSFLTFQSIAFLADVYSGQIRSVNFLDFLFFMLFFPRTIAGPIVHYREVVPQLGDIRLNAALTNVVVGTCLFSIGLFKKTVIADGLIQFVTPTFDPLPWSAGQPPTLLTSWSGALAYTLQLYFDFSGYSDMALGLAKIFGVRLPMNFNSPLKATSIVDFWSRWHMTLTRFLTAYVYTPISLTLTRSRMTQGKPGLKGALSSWSAIAILIYVPTLLTMLVSGLWHGAGWQFVVWGALHGIYLAVNQTWRMLRPRFWPDQVSYHRIMRPTGVFLTFGAVVLALVFFRAPSLESGLAVLRGMLGANGILPAPVQLLDSLGVPLSWEVIQHYQPLSPFIWIAVLCAVAFLMPNSLELLRRFHPALDGPNDGPIAPASERGMASSSPPSGRTNVAPFAAGLRSAFSALSHIKQEGFALTPLLGATAALLFVAGVAAISRGNAFIYGQF